MDCLQNIKMIQVCDSLFPIGAFTLSNGLETYVVNESIRNIEDLEKYLASYVSVLPYNDLGVMMLAYDSANNKDALVELDDLSMAYKAPMEVREGCKRLCNRFLRLWEKIENYPSLIQYSNLIKDKKCIGNHAIAVGLYAHDIQIDKAAAMSIYCYSLINGIITNAVKTIPLSQIDGQKLLHKRINILDKCIQETLKVGLDDLGIGATEIDIYAMNHEVLYSRLYMS